MVNRKSVAAAKGSSPAGIRKSERAKTAPARFRPANDVPSELLDLIHGVAVGAASRSAVPFEAEAVVALEEALEPMLEASATRACTPC